MIPWREGLSRATTPSSAPVTPDIAATVAGAVPIPPWIAQVAPERIERRSRVSTATDVKR